MEFPYERLSLNELLILVRERDKEIHRLRDELMERYAQFENHILELRKSANVDKR